MEVRDWYVLLLLSSAYSWFTPRVWWHDVVSLVAMALIAQGLAEWRR